MLSFILIMIVLPLFIIGLSVILAHLTGRNRENAGNSIR